MKVLSLKQPWAELVLQGRKKIELRKWNTHFRGEFLIHSSKIPDIQSMKDFGFTNLSCGFILGKAKLVDVKKYTNQETFEKDKSLHLATSDWENYGFLLENVFRIKPIPALGKLNFWDFEFS